jgi:DNA-binding PadR family transcriptional regulator
MGNAIRMTYATALVLQALDGGHKYGFDIIDATRLRSGTVYPLLRRLEETGFVRSKWENVSIARSSNRPPRKYYELTKAAHELVANAKARFPSLSAVPDAGRASAT